MCVALALSSLPLLSLPFSFSLAPFCFLGYFNIDAEGRDGALSSVPPHHRCKEKALRRQEYHYYFLTEAKKKPHNF